MGNSLSELKERALAEGSFDAYCLENIKDIHMLAKALYHSNAIEGNPITVNDTEVLLKAKHNDGNILPQEWVEGKYSLKDKCEVEDLASAFEFMYSNIDSSTLDEDFILTLHEEVCNSAQDQDPGRYKEFNNYTVHRGMQKFFTPASDVEEAMENLIDNYNSIRRRTIDDIAELTLEFIHIHPFADGNGRVSRILLNWALITNGYPPIVIEIGERDYYIKLLNDYGNSKDSSGFSNFIEDKVMEIYEKILGGS